MTCEQALEAISASLDGELSAQERVELESHLADCSQCAALMEELSGQSLLLRQLDCTVPEDLSARILARLPDQTRPPARKNRVIHWRRWGTLAACLVLVLWGGHSLSNIRMGSTASGENMAPMSDGAANNAEGESGDFTAYAEPQDAAPADAEPAGLSGGATAEPGAKAAACGTAEIGLIHYIPAQWSEELDAPTARLVSAPDELAALFRALCITDEETLEHYREDFFADASLIAVTLTEPSGSVSHEVRAISETENGWQVEIMRRTPEVGTCDMAAWLILIETDLASESCGTLSVNIVND